MSGLDLSSLSNLTSNIGSLLPSTSQVAEQLALGAATAVVTSGIRAQLGGGALDPLGLFKGQSAANNPAAVTGATITASAFATLPPATQAQLTTAGVHIVAG